MTKFTVSVLAEWMNNMGPELLQVPIQGLSHGKNLQQLSFHVIGVISQIEMGDKAKHLFTEASQSVGYSTQALQAQQEEAQKKGVWKRLFG